MKGGLPGRKDKIINSVKGINSRNLGWKLGRGLLLQVAVSENTPPQNKKLKKNQ